MYTFCKKDGSIKKRYVFACKAIIQAKIENHEITVGRSDDVVRTYDCFTIPKITLNQPKRDSYERKIQEICSNFDITTKEWYSFQDIRIELHGANVERMIEELRILLGGDTYTRQAD